MTNWRKIELLFVLIVFCSPSETRGQDSSWFKDVTEETGLTGQFGMYLVAVDLNGDDYPDLLVYNNTETNRNNLSLYLNEQDPESEFPLDRVFTDFTEESGVNANPDSEEDGRMSSLASPADVDNDGDTDLVTCLYYHRIENKDDYTEEDRCEVLLNDGEAHFTIAENNGLHELGLVNGTGFSFLDYDQDGNIDLYIATFFADYTANDYGFDIMMRGNGDGTFTDVSTETGINSIEAPLYGVNVTDINDDGLDDVITSPYCRTEGSVWKNNGDGTFTDIARGTGYDAHTMPGDNGQPLCQWSAQPADYDNDGDMDLFIGLVHGGNGVGEGRSTIVNNEPFIGGFKLEWDLDRITWDDPQSNHRAEPYSWWLDMDNDGRRDLVVNQCCYVDGWDKTFMLHQNESTHFDDITEELGFTDDGQISSPHGLTVLDYDLDGDDDVLIGLTKQDNQLLLLKNEIGNSNNHLRVKLRGKEGVNMSAIGARVTVTSGDLVLTRELHAGEGHFGAQSPFILIFGLGQRDSIDSVRVRWPGGDYDDTIVENPPVNELLLIEPQEPQPDGGPDGGEDAGIDAGSDAGDEGQPVDGADAADAGADEGAAGEDGCSCLSNGGTWGQKVSVLLLLLVVTIPALLWHRKRRIQKKA